MVRKTIAYLNYWGFELNHLIRGRIALPKITKKSFMYQRGEIIIFWGRRKYGAKSILAAKGLLWLWASIAALKPDTVRWKIALKKFGYC